MILLLLERGVPQKQRNFQFEAGNVIKSSVGSISSSRCDTEILLNQNNQ